MAQPARFETSPRSHEPDLSLSLVQSTVDVDYRHRDDEMVIPDCMPVHHVHGSVHVPGAREPVPYTTAIPEEPLANVHAIVVNGFGAVKRTSREIREALAKEGIATTTFNPIRAHESTKGWLKHLIDSQQLPYQAIGAIVTDIQYNDSYKTTSGGRAIQDAPLLMLPNSMGGLSAIEYAVNNTDRVIGMADIAVCGLDKAGLLRLAARTPLELVTDIVPFGLRRHYGSSILMREFEYFLSNPSRTVGEIVSCGTADKTEKIRSLAQQGVKQLVVCAEKDAFFHPDDTIANTHGVVDKIEVLLDAKHTVMQDEPLRVARRVSDFVQAQY